MSRRRLSDEEEALWRGYVRSIDPLRRARESGKSKDETAEAAAPVKPARSHRSTPPMAEPPPLAPLGRRLKQRVARGREPIEARIDLHGMTQRQAHTELLGFLQRAQADGARTVLIVTGKGRGSGGDPHGERGVLRRQVPLWLELPQFRPFVLGFEDAHVGHGGQGALYVRLRRNR